MRGAASAALGIVSLYRPRFLGHRLGAYAASAAVESWSSRNIQAVAECSTVLAQGVQDISREWLDWAQHRFQQQLEGINALLRCRTPQDFVVVQSDQVRQNLELLIESTRRIAERSVQLAEVAGEKIAIQAEETAGRARRSADRARRAA